MDMDQQAYQNFIESDQTLYTYYETGISNTESIETAETLSESQPVIIELMDQPNTCLSNNTLAASSIVETNSGNMLSEVMNNIVQNNNISSIIKNDTDKNNKLRLITDCTLRNARSKRELTSQSDQQIKLSPKNSILSHRNLKTKYNGRKYSQKKSVKSLSKSGNFGSSPLKPGTPAFQNSPSAKFFCGIVGSKEFPLPVGTPLEKPLTKKSPRKCFAFSSKNGLREPPFKTPESTTPSTPQNPSTSPSNKKSSSKKGSFSNNNHVHTANRDKIKKPLLLSQNLNNKQKYDIENNTVTTKNQKCRRTKTKNVHEASNLTSTEPVINTVETLAIEPVHTEFVTTYTHSRDLNRIPALKTEPVDTEFVSIKIESHSPEHIEDTSPEIPATVSGLEERTNDNVNKLIDLLEARYKQDYDETDLLFLSYAKSVKKLPRNRQVAIKFKIARMFMEDELDNMNIELQCFDESDDDVKCVNTDDPLHAKKQINEVEDDDDNE